jgi:hypothetical protein
MPGSRRAAALYSLIESAKLNGLDPRLYLADVLARIADHPARRIAEPPALELATDRRHSRCRLSLPARRTLTRNHATRCDHWIPPIQSPSLLLPHLPKLQKSSPIC